MGGISGAKCQVSTLEKVPKSAGRPVMGYGGGMRGGEWWAKINKEETQLYATYAKMLRWIQGKSRPYHILEIKPTKIILSSGKKYSRCSATCHVIIMVWSNDANVD